MKHRCCKCNKVLGSWVELLEDMDLEQIYCSTCTNKLIDELKKEKNEDKKHK